LQWYVLVRQLFCFLCGSEYFEEIDQADDGLDDGGTWCCECNAEQRHRLNAGKEVGKRQTYTDAADDVFDHDDLCMSTAVEEASNIEEERRNQAVNGIGLQIIGTGGDNLRISGEEAAQHLAMEEGEPCHYGSDSERYEDAVAHRFAGPVHTIGSIVLGNEGCHRL